MLCCGAVAATCCHVSLLSFLIPLFCHIWSLQALPLHINKPIKITHYSLMWNFCFVITWWFVIAGVVWGDVRPGPFLTLCSCRPVFCCSCCCFFFFFFLLFSVLHKVKHGNTLPCDVLGKVVQGVYLEGVCSSGVLRKQSQHRWCSMPLHMAGSPPGELSILLHSCLSLCFSPSTSVTPWVSFCLLHLLPLSVCLRLHLYLWSSLSMNVCCPDVAHRSSKNIQLLKLDLGPCFYLLW